MYIVKIFPRHEIPRHPSLKVKLCLGKKCELSSIGFCKRNIVNYPATILTSQYSVSVSADIALMIDRLLGPFIPHIRYTCT